jgi:nitrate reductase NapE component
MLKQVNRMEYFREYAEYWYIGARTYLLKTIVYLVCAVLVAMVFPLGSLLFFALAGRSHYKVWMFNFVVNNPGRSLVLVK